jgi:D-galactarolactone cycloisomerase
VKIKNAQVHHLRVPIETPVKTSFGIMDSRHAVFLILEDESGLQGIGESWVNFPKWAPWERVFAFEKGYIPYLKGQKVKDIASFIVDMASAFQGPAQQSGTMGSYLQALCAVEMALWDLAAKIENIPLNKLLFKNPASSVRVYGSGINSPIQWKIVDEHLAKGVALFKLKLGFGRDTDIKNLEDMSSHLGDSARIAVDVNRRWTIEEASQWLPVLKEFNVQWLEEPLLIEDEDKLKDLHDKQLMKIAGGENFLMDPVSCDMQSLADSPLDIFQPDITKYCCIHDALDLLKAVNQRGRKLFPHFLGSAPGQAASLHLASGCGDVLMELDVNPNPLRTSLFKEPFEIQNGSIEIPETPGIGWELDPDKVEIYLM